MTVCGEFIHLSNYCWGDAMAEEKLFEGQIKKYFHSVGIYPAGYPTDRMNAPMDFTFEDFKMPEAFKDLDGFLTN